MRKTSIYARKRARGDAFDRKRHEVINPVTEAVIRSRIEADIQRLRTDTGLQAYMGNDAERLSTWAGGTMQAPGLPWQRSTGEPHHEPSIARAPRQASAHS